MYHQVLIAGNLGREPEMRYTPTGMAVTHINVASTRKYKSGDGELVEETIWFRVSIWGKQAETCNQFLKKGSRVLVEGRLVPDAATGSPRVFTRQDGSSGAAFEVSANTVRFLSSRGEDGGNGAGEALPAQEKTENWDNW